MFLLPSRRVISVLTGSLQQQLRKKFPKKAQKRLSRLKLRKPITKVEKDAEGNEHEVVVPNLFHIRNRALIKELIQWNPYGNYDRVLSLVQLILYREEKMVLFQGDMKRSQNKPTGMEADDYWRKNYPGLKQSVSRFISSTK